MTTHRGLSGALVALLSGCGCGPVIVEENPGVRVADGGALPQIQAFFASPTSVPSNGGVTQLSFNVTGATNVSITPGVGDVTGMMSAQATVLTNTTFTLTATNAIGSVTATTAVTVEPVVPQPPEISFFTGTPAVLPIDGGTARLAWDVTGADNLVIDRGVGDVTGRTSTDVALRVSTTYTLTARAPGGMTSRSVTVLVSTPRTSICDPSTVLVDGGAVSVSATSLGSGRSIVTWGTGAGAFGSVFDGGTWSSPSSFSSRQLPTTSVVRTAGNAAALAFVAEDADAVILDGLTGAALSSVTFRGAPRISGNETSAFAWATNSSDARSFANSSWATVPPVTGDVVTSARLAMGLGGHVVVTRLTRNGLTIAYKNAAGWDPAFEYTLGFEEQFPVDYETAVLSNGDLLVLWQDRTLGARTWLQRYRRASARFDLPQLLHTVPVATPGGLLKLLVDRQDRVTALHAAFTTPGPILFASRDFGGAMQPAVPVANALFVASDLDLDTGTLAVASGSPAVVRWTTATSQTWLGPLPTALTNRNMADALAIAVGREQHVQLAFVTSNGEVRANDCLVTEDFDGGAPFVPDAGLPVDAGTPNFTFSVTSGLSRPLAGALALLVGPTRRSTIISSSSGEFSVAWPLSERPFDLTVVAAGHEAVSVLGITNELPTKIRIDPTNAIVQTYPISGAITGKLSAGNRVELDLVDGVTPMPVTGTTWSAQYRDDSTQPITVVAIEFNSSGNEVNWTKGTVARPAAGGAVTLDLAFPSVPRAFQTMSHTFVAADAGLFSGNALMNAQSLGLVAHYVDLTPGAEAFLQSGVVSRSGATLTGIGIVDVLAPNRMRHSIPAGGPFFISQWMIDPFTTSMSSNPLPELTRLVTTGSSLATVGANAQSPDFDTLELQVSLGDTTYWRVYSAPGAPFTVRLPDLPAGFHPQNMIRGRSTASVLALLIKFEAPTTRGWRLQGGDRTLVPYRFTVANSYRTISTTWR
jgi:hypothetical protein